jgi:hypothetical protein
MSEQLEDATWTMPEWMEPYRPYIRNTGGNDVEDLMSDNHTDVRSNAIRAALCVAVKSQVALLEMLHRTGRLVAASHEEPG